MEPNIKPYVKLSNGRPCYQNLSFDHKIKIKNQKKKKKGKKKKWVKRVTSAPCSTQVQTKNKKDPYVYVAMFYYIQPTKLTRIFEKHHDDLPKIGGLV